MFFLAFVSVTTCFAISLILRIYTRDNVISYVGTYIIGIFIILVGHFVSVEIAGSELIVEIFLLVFPAAIGAALAHAAYHFGKPILYEYLESKLD